MINFISLESVLIIHDTLIEEYGGLGGVLNIGLLQSALEMPKAMFNGRYLHQTVFDKAAAYLYHIIKNHAFVDGNKRTAGMISLVFLASQIEVIPFGIIEDEYEQLILQTAQGKASKKEIAKFFRYANKASR